MMMTVGSIGTCTRQFEPADVAKWPLGLCDYCIPLVDGRDVAAHRVGRRSKKI